MNIVTKLLFFLKRPKVILIVGLGRKTAAEAISNVLRAYFNVGEDVLIFEPDLENLKNDDALKFVLNNSAFPILVVTHTGDIPADKEFFSGDADMAGRIMSLAKMLPSYGYVLLNRDDAAVKKIKDEAGIAAKRRTFGFSDRAIFKATDVAVSSGTNFKINYKGNSVPIWMDKIFGKEQVYAALSAVGAGTLFGRNLVEISQAFKTYQSLPGKMRLIKGIKNSCILDDSESSTVFSMTEAVELLGKIENGKRRIAVLGDVLGEGRYTIDAHEAIGGKVAKNADLLFTFGLRARFIAEGAQNKKMPADRIFQFNTLGEGKIALQNEIKEGDLILVDGSKEMKMKEIIKEIRAG